MCVRCGTGRIAECTSPDHHGDDSVTKLSTIETLWHEYVDESVHEGTEASLQDFGLWLQNEGWKTSGS